MVKHRILHGEPIKVGDREIIPETKLTWVARRRATFGTNHASAYSWAVLRLEPSALIERALDRTRRIPIYNQTQSLLFGLLVGALAVPFMMELAVRLARPKRKT